MLSFLLRKCPKGYRSSAKKLHPLTLWVSTKPPSELDDLGNKKRTRGYISDENVDSITSIDVLVDAIESSTKNSSGKAPGSNTPGKPSAPPAGGGASKPAKCPPNDTGCKQPPAGGPPGKPPPPPPPKHVSFQNSPDPKIKIYKIFRWQPGKKAELKSYKVDLRHCGPSQLDALFYIKNKIDGSLSFRRSCREGTCGVCAVNLDGLNKLPCIKKVDRNLSKPTIIYPLPHMYVIRDLVVDFSNFYEQYKFIQPWLQRRLDICEQGKAPYMQSIEDRAKLDGLWECHLCGCCSFSCPAYWQDSDKFLGPAALLHLYRWLVDSRDDMTEERLRRVSDANSVFKCTNIHNCANTCPKHLTPNIYISKIKRLLAGWIKKDTPMMLPNALHRAGYDVNTKCYEIKGATMEKAMKLPTPPPPPPPPKKK